MAGESVTGTTKSGVTLTQQIPVLVGGVDANGVVRTLVVNSDGSLASKGVDPLAAALGYVNWNANPGLFANGSTMTSQTIYAASIYLPIGKICTGIVLDVTTAAAGTKPTSFAIGLCSATKMLAQSAADISGASGAPFAATGETQIAFSGTYTTLASDSASGLFYVVATQNGAYTTPVQFARGIAVAGSGAALAGQSPVHGTIGTGQTALPANAAAVTVTAGSTGWFVGVY